MELIDKNKVLDEIQRMIQNISKADVNGELASIHGGQQYILMKIFGFVDNLEVEDGGFKPMDSDFERDAVSFCIDNGLNTTPYIAKTIAKHFFELGLKVNNPTTAADRGIAEEIIVNLKRIEQDYCIDLTKEMKWLRGIVKKGE